MPPGIGSRHLQTLTVTRTTDGQAYLLDREPIRYVDRADNKRIIAQQSDTWQSLAANYLEPLPNPDNFYWVICDFQPDPIIDPTIQPTPGTIVYIPAPEYVLGNYWSPSREDAQIV